MSQLAGSKTAEFQAELIASVLFRYPEMCSIKVQLHKGIVTFTFLLKGSMEKEDWKRFAKKLRESLMVYHQLQFSLLTHLDVSWQSAGKYFLVEVTRDSASLQREELSIIVALVRESSYGKLIVEGLADTLAEEAAWQDELIDHMLKDIRTGKRREDILAFRDAGRVVVFDRGKVTRPRKRRESK